MWDGVLVSYWATGQTKDEKAKSVQRPEGTGGGQNILDSREQ